MTALISPEDEPAVRLFAFGAALLAITVGRSVTVITPDGVPVAIDSRVLEEARLIADAVVAEAKRLGVAK